MPELPEVETVRRTLERQILNKTITDVKVYYERMLENCTKEDFISTLKGKTIKKIDRYGKYLIFIFDDCSLISHLRMEGKFFIKNLDAPKEKHEHIVFTLDNSISFRYHDTRKFGRMALLNTIDKAQIMKYPALEKLGKEANDETFTEQELLNKLSKKNVFIKTALLDQEIICGLGNIYVDEVCFMSRLNPFTLTKEITLKDARNILESSRIVLAKAIQAGGTTIRSYTSSLGVTGLFQLELLVHSKENEPCPVCKTPIVKTKVGGRGTYYCPRCQTLPNKKVIGITGSIATGKTTVTTYLKEKGYVVLDADEIVKEEKKPNKLIYKALINKFDRKILNSNNEIDDKKLAQFIYESEHNRQVINKIIHPIVYDVLEDEIVKAPHGLIFVSVPLMFEAHFDSLCQKIICVKTSDDVQINRLMNRNNLTLEEAKKRIDAHMTQEEKCQKSDYIIDNSKELCYTIEQVNEIIRKEE